MSSPLELGPNDLQQLRERGIDEAELRRQIACFERGFRPMDLVGPATLDDGIEILDPDRHDVWLARWEQAARAGRLSKFVPASGAATRMFKTFEARRARPEPIDDAELARGRAQGSGEASELARFFDEFDRFAFAGVLREALAARGFDADAIVRGDAGTDRRVVLDVMLGEEALGYAQLPKGLIPFHRDGDAVRTAFEEHLEEATEVVADQHGVARVHFTVAPEYRARIVQHCRRAAHGHDLGFSEQSPSTDTVAVDRRHVPLRDADGSLVFRPGGHGALLGNLDALEADVVFLKNVDNVVPRGRRGIVVEHQRLLAGVLLERLEQTHAHWHRLQDGEADIASVEQAMDFVRDRLHRTPPTAVAAANTNARRAWLLDVLARPLRVCGMVRNEGEPGGGPYRVRDAEGGVSLQIVEAVQIDRDDPVQDAHVRGATHFNPVDLVCALRGPRGEQLELSRYVDPEAGFIALKSKDGVELQALERPGLWNGAMAHWNTVFVEVPLETFQPVKTVLDLLRPAHQAR